MIPLNAINGIIITDRDQACDHQRQFDHWEHYANRRNNCCRSADQIVRNFSSAKQIFQIFSSANQIVRNFLF